MPRTLSTRARALAFAAILVAPSGCGATAPPPSSAATSAPPSGSLVLGIDWGRAPSVEAPKNFEVDPSEPPYKGVHPILRFPGQAMIVDVTRLRDGGFVAVGYVPPDWIPAAWTSSDGLNWSLHFMGETAFTLPVAVTTGPDGAIVAVGHQGLLPAAWISADGITWQQQAVRVLPGNDAAERMTTVTAGGPGFVAGGSVGPELFDRHARFWTSADGVQWQPVPDDEGAFANAEVRSIVKTGDGLVAVGVVGPAQHPSSAVAWTSPDGSKWTRIAWPAFEDGIAVSVVPAPFGGLVAVGSDVGRHNAVAWTSPDGRQWTRASDEASRQHPGGYAWMTDVVATEDSVIAIGASQSGQRGTGTSWVSRDGSHWTQAHIAPVQEQGEFYAIATGGPGAIVVGSFGAPDSYVPRIWITPAR